MLPNVDLKTNRLVDWRIDCISDNEEKTAIVRGSRDKNEKNGCREYDSEYPEADNVKGNICYCHGRLCNGNSGFSLVASFAFVGLAAVTTLVGNFGKVREI